MKIINRIKLLIATLILSAAFITTGNAFPDKGVTLIVAYGAGGGTDTTARLLAKDLESTFLSTDTICATVKLAETFCCTITENPTGNPTTRPTSSKSKSGKSDDGSTKSGKDLVKGKSGKSSVSLDSLDIQRSVLTKYNLSNHPYLLYQ